MMSKFEIAAILRSLRTIPLFQSLGDAELKGILEAPENRIETYAAKQQIVREAELGDCMYVIIDGSAEVTVRAEAGGREITIATLHSGDFFGEQALLPGSSGRRNAGVRALYDCKLFRIAKKYVLLNIQHEDHLEEEEETEALTVSSYIDQPEDQDIKNLLKSMRLFRSLLDKEISCFREWIEVINVAPGEFVIKESQQGEHLFVVLEGSVEIFLLDSEGKVVVLAEHKRGNYFGEQALMPRSDGKRNAYVRTNRKSRLLKIPKQYFRLLLDRDSKLAETLTKIGDLQKDVNSKLIE